MLNFLKKLFKKEEAKEEKISINELESWFNGRASSLFKELDTKIGLIKEKIKEEIEKTKENLDILEKAQLHNPKISLREKQFMEGNREAYLKKVGIFLKQINLEGGYEELLQFCSNFNDMLDSFGKSTFRPYKILQEFLANESRDVAINIKKLDNLIKELKGMIRDADLDSVQGLGGHIIQLKNKIKQKEENEEISSQKEKEREDLTHSVDSIKKEINNLENSWESSKLNELKAEKEIILTKIRGNNGRLIYSFSVIERALRKYSRIALEDEKLVSGYAENPIKALLSDNELKIIKILEGLEKNVLNNQIDLKDKKKEKTLEIIKELNKGFFDGFLKKGNELENELDNIEDKIKENEIEGKLKEIKNRLEQKNSEMERIDKEIIRLKDDADINMEDLKRKLEEKIKDTLKVSIKIL